MGWLITLFLAGVDHSVDVACSPNNKGNGYGVVLRNDKGEIVLAQAFCRGESFLVEAGKIMAIMFGLHLVEGLGCFEVWVQSDAEVVVKKTQSPLISHFLILGFSMPKLLT